MAGLTTHVLDTANGMPASGVALRLFAAGDTRELLIATVTNDDGRTDAPLLDGQALQTGNYELEFDLGDYFSCARRNTRRPGVSRNGCVTFRRHCG